jgi:hypothetical protein
VKYFLDTEFIENGKTIDLISIGMACEDGRTFYAINKECDFSKASDWVIENVLTPIGLSKKGFDYEPSCPSISGNYKSSYSLARSRFDIAIKITEFLKPDYNRETSEYPTVLSFKPAVKPEIWAYYADYDWVVFCQLFGTMMDLPKGFPMYCRDIKQLCDDLGNPELPKQKSGKHNALADAKWNKQAWEYLDNVRLNTTYSGG